MNTTYATSLGPRARRQLSEDSSHAAVANPSTTAQPREVDLRVSPRFSSLAILRSVRGLRQLRRKYPFLALLIFGVCLWLGVASTLWFSDFDSPIRDMDETTATYAAVREEGGYWRIKPHDVRRTIHGDIQDDFRVGKSCHWRRHWFWLWTSYWDCRDCKSFTNKWRQCERLSRRGKCSAPKSQDWNGPRPAASSTYDPSSANPNPIRLLTSYGVGKVRKVLYEQPECPQGVSGSCFDQELCRDSRTGDILHPIPVYAYPGKAQTDLAKALSNEKLSQQQSFRSVSDTDSACLYFVHDDDIQRAMESPTWRHGLNHFVFGLTRPPPTSKTQYGLAALGTFVGTQTQVRWGFDIPLPLPALWQPTPEHRNKHSKDLILGFRGTIQDSLQPYYHQRWLAAEYLHQTPKVDINVQCKHKTLRGDLVVVAPYDEESLPGKHSYEDMMGRSVFGFCPGGSHANSFRFTEVLSGGSIPVLLPESVAPYSPEVNWSKCVVRVSQARIVDLPRILASISAEEIRHRQKECRSLYENYLKHEPGQWQGLEVSLQILRKRLKTAFYSSQLVVQ